MLKILDTSLDELQNFGIFGSKNVLDFFLSAATKEGTDVLVGIATRTLL